MREGYKKTEVGVIPEDWEVKKLGDIGEFKNGLNKGKEDFGFGYKFVNIQDAYNGQVINIDLLGKINATKDEVETYKLQKGDIVIVRSSVKPSGVGYPILYNDNREDILYCGFMIRYRYDIQKYNPLFMLYQLRGEKTRKKVLSLSTVSANTNINQESLNIIKIAVPPLKEQEKIAEIISTVDSQIDDTEKLIKKSKELKKGLMQKLLTKGIGHSEFKKTEVGEIPVEWEVCKIGAKSNVKSSKRVYKSDYIEHGIPFYRSKEIIELSKNIEPTVELYIDESKYNEFKDKFGAPKKGDLLITSVGSVGSTWVSDGRQFYYKDGNLTQIDNNQNINTKFLSYLFESDYLKRQYLGQSNGSAQVALTIEKLKKLVIALPSIDEQDRIVSILLNVDNEIKEYENKKQKLEELKKGLMQQLLTGKIRTV